MCRSEMAEYLVSEGLTLPPDESCFTMAIIKIKIATFLLTVSLIQWRLEGEVGGWAEGMHGTHNVAWLGTGYLPVLSYQIED